MGFTHGGFKLDRFRGPVDAVADDAADELLAYGAYAVQAQAALKQELHRLLHPHARLHSHAPQPGIEARYRVKAPHVDERPGGVRGHRPRVTPPNCAQGPWARQDS